MNIRLANFDDIERIHLTHMQSIQEVCSEVYTAVEINAWGGRSLDLNKWQKAIEEDHVYVVENEMGGCLINGIQVRCIPMVLKI